MVRAGRRGPEYLMSSPACPGEVIRVPKGQSDRILPGCARAGPRAGWQTQRKRGRLAESPFLPARRTEMTNIFTMAVDGDGIATITWDLPGASMNVRAIRDRRLPIAP